MKPNSGPGHAMGEGYKLLGLGMTFAGGIILFMLIGLLIDRWLGVIPLFTVIGTLGGAALSFTNVYMKLTAAERADKAGKPGAESQEPAGRSKKGRGGRGHAE